MHYAECEYGTGIHISFYKILKNVNEKFTYLTEYSEVSA